MIDLHSLATDLAWPASILLAWVLGEFFSSNFNIPRITIYALVGFILTPTQTGPLPHIQSETFLLFVNIAFGLILFDCGYRINLGWLRINPWIGVISLVESTLAFVFVFAVVLFSGLPMSTALLIGALFLATSPATILRTIDEQKSSGQVTQRLMHLSAFSSVIGVLFFQIILGLVIFHSSGNLWDAIRHSIILLVASAFLGAAAGVMVQILLRPIRYSNPDCTIAFVLSVIALVIITHHLKLSPILTTLSFGLTSRHRRITLNQSKRRFFALGEILSVMLFMFVAATVEWEQAWLGFGLGALIVASRQIAKILGITIFSRVSGISLRKGLLIGIGAAPVSAFAILLLEQTRYIGINLVNQLAPVAAAVILLEVFGPVLTQRALIWASESQGNR